MTLLPADVRAQLPPLYSQEHSKDPIVHLKLFSPYANWTWLITEGSPEGDDFLLFGYVMGFEEEWGYVSLRELESLTRGPLPLVERDLSFQPGPFQQVLARFRGERTR